MSAAASNRPSTDAAQPDLSALEAEVAQAQDIRDIKGMVPLSPDWSWVGWALLAVILAVAAYYFWRHRRRRPGAATVQVEPQIPPHLRAYSRLEEARRLSDPPRPFCILVSDTVRIYLEERFRLRAPERTTEEFLDEMQSSALLSLEQKQRLGSFLMACDLVKFARDEPNREKLEEILGFATRLIDETKPETEATAAAPVAVDRAAVESAPSEAAPQTNKTCS